MQHKPLDLLKKIKNHWEDQPPRPKLMGGALFSALVLYLLWPSSPQKRSEKPSPPPQKMEEKKAPKPLALKSPPIPKKDPPIKAKPPLVKEESFGFKAKVQPKESQNLDDSFAPFDKQGRHYIQHVIKQGEHLVYHGDVLLGPAEELPQIIKRGFVRKATPRKWPKGEIPYVIHEGVVQKEQVLEAIDYLNHHTNLHLFPRQEEKDYVLVIPGEQHCYAYAGRIGGVQEMVLSPSCGLREILHEWMHTIGFFHEQNREDRDQYLKIHWENIHEVHHFQFKKLPNDFMGIKGRPFDFQSIMLYSSLAFSLNGEDPAMVTSQGELIPPSTQLLSEEDLARVNKAYEKH